MDLGAIDKDPTLPPDKGVKTQPEETDESLSQDFPVEEMKVDLLRRQGIVMAAGRAAFDKLYASVPRYVLSAEFWEACESPEQLVGRLGCLEEHRAEWVRLVEERKKAGITGQEFV